MFWFILAVVNALNEKAVRSNLIQYVNNDRALRGLQPICGQGNLDNAAERHSNEMAIYNEMVHENRQFGSPWDRMRESGYAGFSRSENILKTPFGARSDEEFARHLYMLWKTSPGHWKNIIDPSVNRMGFAYEKANRNQFTFATQNFGVGGQPCDSQPRRLNPVRRIFNRVTHPVTSVVKNAWSWLTGRKTADQIEAAKFEQQRKEADARARALVEQNAQKLKDAEARRIILNDASAKASSTRIKRLEQRKLKLELEKQKKLEEDKQFLLKEKDSDDSDSTKSLLDDVPHAQLTKSSEDTKKPFFNLTDFSLFGDEKSGQDDSELNSTASNITDSTARISDSNELSPDNSTVATTSTLLDSELNTDFAAHIAKMEQEIKDLGTSTKSFNSRGETEIAPSTEFYRTLLTIEDSVNKLGDSNNDLDPKRAAPIVSSGMTSEKSLPVEPDVSNTITTSQLASNKGAQEGELQDSIDDGLITLPS
eukprot:NODE_88_length_21932_cov_0.317867.p2 type:complete len:481 gc:universal NODE_88_length_21932_cov_0.317867:16299-17741(+)